VSSSCREPRSPGLRWAAWCGAVTTVTAWKKRARVCIRLPPVHGPAYGDGRTGGAVHAALENRLAEPRSAALDPRGDLTDAEWERLRPFLPVSKGRCGRWRDHRQVIDGILHRVRTGVQWRDLPERFGPRKTVYEGSRPQPTRQVKLTGTSRWTPPSSACISTRPGRASIRPLRPPQRGPTRGNTRTRRRGRASSAAWWELVLEVRAWGRSQGGFTSKIHLSADGRCRPLSQAGLGPPSADTPRWSSRGAAPSSCGSGPLPRFFPPRR
jgi:hypothetical protein